MMMGRGFAYSFGPYGCGMFPMIIIILIAGLMIYLILKQHRSKNAFIHQSSKALDILNERFAKGEMTQEEYEKIKKVIQ